MLISKLSVTQIGRSKSCPLSLYYTLTEPAPKRGIALICGSIFHDCLQKYFLAKAEGLIWDWKRMEGLFYELWAGQDWTRVDMGKFLELQAKERTKLYLFNYWKHFCPLLYAGRQNNYSRPYVELYLKAKVELGSRQIFISGKIDLLDGARVCHDHKSSRDLKSFNRFNDGTQAQIYPLLCKSAGIEIKGFQYNVVDDKNFETFKIELNPEEQKSIINDAFEIQTDFENDNIQPAKNPQWTCKFCEWRKDVCKQWNEKKLRPEDI